MTPALRLIVLSLLACMVWAGAVLGGAVTG